MYDFFGEDVSRPVSSPATIICFELREHTKKLSENKGDPFHSVVE